MAKRIQVGGRIESKEVGGIVTGAAEILDDAKGKKQSVINGETDDELLRLDQSKQDNLTFDNAPTEGSDNPVKSGGLYTAQQAILLAIAAINELIPSAASTLNQLADKAFVNSSISTNTATFRGTSAAGLNEQQFLAWANGLEHDLNDYVFWQTSDAAGNTLFKRYKWNGTEWRYEYTLNNSTFTAEQWEAIQSGITALLVAKLRALPTAQELIQSFDSKQDVLTFDNVPTLGSTNPVKSSGIFNAIKEVSDALNTFITETEALIPAEATAQNQLADKADVAAKIVDAIPSWKGQYDALTDLQAVTGAKAGDMGCVKTTDSDGHAVLTFYQYRAQGAWVVYYTLRHYAQNKPATTGTTGDYAYNGMGRIELQKNIVNGVNTLTQAMLTQQSTVYVIQYDFTLGEDITIPANCVLEFDGGHINCGNYSFGGSVLNSWLDVSCFTVTNDITKALNVVLNISNAFVPKGMWSITDNVSIPSERILFGINMYDSIVYVNSSYSFKIDRKSFITIKNIGFRETGTEYALKINGARYITVDNVHIDSLYTGDESRNQGSGILIKNIQSEDYYGTTLSIFKNIHINDVQYGIVLDSTTNNSTDYITDCTFENIKIDSFYNTGLKILGQRVYENRFNNLTIRDGFKGSNDRYGVWINGSAEMTFNNLITWADAKNGTNEFYALWLAGSAAGTNSFNYINGTIEGKIGGIEGYENYFEKYKFDAYVTGVSSKGDASDYIGPLTNCNITKIQNIENKFNFSYITNKTTNVLGGGTKDGYDGNLRITSESAGAIGIEVSLDTKVPDYFRILTQVKCSGGSSNIYETRIVSNGSTRHYYTYNSLQDIITGINVSNVASNLDGNSFYLQIKANNATEILIRNVWIISFQDEETAKMPIWVFLNNPQFVNLIRTIDLF